MIVLYFMALLGYSNAMMALGAHRLVEAHNMKYNSLFSIATFAFSSLSLFAQNPVTADSPFQVRYASNLTIGDSVFDVTNTGASSVAVFPAPVDGNLCANFYTFSPDEQLISCCACLVTPNGLVSISAKGDLTSNTLTPGLPTAIVVKIISSSGTAAAGGATVCNASTAGIGANGLVIGLAAWGTTLHALPVTPGSPATTYGVTETPFVPASLSAAELVRITTLCGFIQTNGSGYGVCKPCRLGGLGAAKGQ